MLVVPATWEAEAGELLEPGKRRLQIAEILSLHSNLGNRARLSQNTNIHKDWVGGGCRLVTGGGQMETVFPMGWM